jgi:hypothetical protein
MAKTAKGKSHSLAPRQIGWDKVWREMWEHVCKRQGREIAATVQLWKQRETILNKGGLW